MKLEELYAENVGTFKKEKDRPEIMVVVLVGMICLAAIASLYV